MTIADPRVVHPDLTPDRLAALGTIIDSVWVSARNSYDDGAGDDPWVFGCTFFGRLCTTLRRQSVNISWLRIVEKRMHFVFTVGAVPVRFYRGRSGRVKAGYLNRRSPEIRQQLLAFDGLPTELNSALRVAVVATHVDDHPKLVLVRQSATSSEEIYEIPLRRVLLPTPSYRKPPVRVAPPKVGPKKAPAKRSVEDEGA